MIYKYRTIYPPESLAKRTWAELRWDIEYLIHIFPIVNISHEEIEESEGAVNHHRHFTLEFPRELTNAELKIIDEHMHNSDIWGTLRYPFNGQRENCEKILAPMIQKASNGAAYFRGFSGAKLNIGSMRELTQEEKDAVENVLGTITWQTT